MSDTLEDRVLAACATLDRVSISMSPTGKPHYIADLIRELWNTRAAPTVKPLVWKAWGSDCLIGAGDVTPHLEYNIENFGSLWVAEFTISVGRSISRERIGEGSGIDEAKAASQAHYAARILSELEDST